jgi:hypothetical protein
MLQKIVKSKVKALAGKLVSPVHAFHNNHYLRHNARRLEHLASLRIPLAGSSVLEVGAGIGDHSHYYMDRNCRMTITEARPENLAHLKSRYPNCDVRFLDMDSPSDIDGGPFDVVHCYGLLYHLSKPQQALAFLSNNTAGLLLLETCVSFGEDEQINLIGEPQSDATQAFSGTGCRPTRPWLFRELKSHFEHVYVPLTQPCHDEFPLDWQAPDKHLLPLQRAVFVASRKPLQNELLSTALPLEQSRHQ